MVLSALYGEGWRQAGELGLAFVLSGLIGLEREVRHKDAGLRTHILVGVGAALFLLVSKYGFSDVIEQERVVLDPSRVAAQIASGIGFLGAGIIFVRRDVVHGLTTAAAVWVTAAIGMAAGAGLSILAALTTAVYLVVVIALPLLTARIPRWWGGASEVRVRYPEGKGKLRDLLEQVTSLDFAIDKVSTESVDEGEGRTVEVVLHVRGKTPPRDLAAALSELSGVTSVAVGDPDAGNS